MPTAVVAKTSTAMAMTTQTPKAAATSTKHSKRKSKKSKKQPPEAAQSPDETKRQIKKIQRLVENSKCIDCLARRPTWGMLLHHAASASASSSSNSSSKKNGHTLRMGAFCCLECAGAHKNVFENSANETAVGPPSNGGASPILGLSKHSKRSAKKKEIGVCRTTVRSVHLDEWTQEDVLIMQQFGNQVVNSIYEAQFSEAQGQQEHRQQHQQDEQRVRPMEEGATPQIREQFIRKKYQQLLWYSPNQHEYHIHMLNGTTNSAAKDSAKSPRRKRASLLTKFLSSPADKTKSSPETKSLFSFGASKKRSKSKSKKKKQQQKNAIKNGLTVIPVIPISAHTAATGSTKTTAATKDDFDEIKFPEPSEYRKEQKRRASGDHATSYITAAGYGASSVDFTGAVTTHFHSSMPALMHSTHAATNSTNSNVNTTEALLLSPKSFPAVDSSTFHSPSIRRAADRRLQLQRRASTSHATSRQRRNSNGAEGINAFQLALTKLKSDGGGGGTATRRQSGNLELLDLYKQTGSPLTPGAKSAVTAPTKLLQRQNSLKSAVLQQRRLGRVNSRRQRSNSLEMLDLYTEQAECATLNPPLTPGAKSTATTPTLPSQRQSTPHGTRRARASRAQRSKSLELLDLYKEQHEQADLKRFGAPLTPGAKSAVSTPTVLMRRENSSRSTNGSRLSRKERKQRSKSLEMISLDAHQSNDSPEIPGGKSAAAMPTATKEKTRQKNDAITNAAMSLLTDIFSDHSRKDSIHKRSAHSQHRRSHLVKRPSMLADLAVSKSPTAKSTSKRNEAVLRSKSDRLNAKQISELASPDDPTSSNILSIIGTPSLDPMVLQLDMTDRTTPQERRNSSPHNISVTRNALKRPPSPRRMAPNRRIELETEALNGLISAEEELPDNNSSNVGRNQKHRSSRSASRSRGGANRTDHDSDTSKDFNDSRANSRGRSATGARRATSTSRTRPSKSSKRNSTDKSRSPSTRQKRMLSTGRASAISSDADNISKPSSIRDDGSTCRQNRRSLSKSARSRRISRDDRSPSIRNKGGTEFGGNDSAEKPTSLRSDRSSHRSRHSLPISQAKSSDATDEERVSKSGLLSTFGTRTLSEIRDYAAVHVEDNTQRSRSKPSDRRGRSRSSHRKVVHASRSSTSPCANNAPSQFKNRDIGDGSTLRQSEQHQAGGGRRATDMSRHDKHRGSLRSSSTGEEGSMRSGRSDKVSVRSERSRSSIRKTGPGVTSKQRSKSKGEAGKGHHPGSRSDASTSPSRSTPRRRSSTSRSKSRSRSRGDLESITSSEGPTSIAAATTASAETALAHNTNFFLATSKSSEEKKPRSYSDKMKKQLSFPNIIDVEKSRSDDKLHHSVSSIQEGNENLADEPAIVADKAHTNDERHNVDDTDDLFAGGGTADRNGKSEQPEAAPIISSEGVPGSMKPALTSTSGSMLARHLDSQSWHPNRPSGENNEEGSRASSLDIIRKRLENKTMLKRGTKPRAGSDAFEITKKRTSKGKREEMKKARAAVKLDLFARLDREEEEAALAAGPLLRRSIPTRSKSQEGQVLSPGTELKPSALNIRSMAPARSKSSSSASAFSVAGGASLSSFSGFANKPENASIDSGADSSVRTRTTKKLMPVVRQNPVINHASASGPLGSPDVSLHSLGSNTFSGDDFDFE